MGLFDYFNDDPGAPQSQGGILNGAGPMAGNQKAALLFAGLRDMANSFSGGAPSNYADQQGQEFYRQNAIGSREMINKKIQAAYASGDMNQVRQALMQADPQDVAHITQAMNFGQPKFQEVGDALYQLPGLDGGAPKQVVAAPLKAPQTRTIQRGLNSVEQQFNQTSGAFDDIPGAIGPKFKPDKAPAPTPTIGAQNPAAMFRRRR